MSLGGILTAALILAAAQTLTSATGNSKSGASGVLSFARYPAALARNWMDPTVPLIPQRTAATTATATAAAPIELATLGQAT